MVVLAMSVFGPSLSCLLLLCIPGVITENGFCSCCAEYQAMIAETKADSPEVESSDVPAQTPRFG